MSRIAVFFLLFFFTGQISANEKSLNELCGIADSIVESYWGETSTIDFIRLNGNATDVSYITPSGKEDNNSLGNIDDDSISKIRYVYFNYAINHPAFGEYVSPGIEGETDSALVFSQKIIFSLDANGKIINGNSGLIYIPEVEFTSITKSTAYNLVAQKEPALTQKNSNIALKWWAFKTSTNKDSINNEGIVQGRFVYQVSFSTIDPRAPWEVNKKAVGGMYCVDFITGKIIAKQLDNKTWIYIKD